MNTLTDRYVDAVVRALPERHRDDVARELQASIADQLEVRLESGEEADAAERAVLIELGDPDRLAAAYADRPLQLIGPRYYLDWKRLLILLLWIVPACAGAGVTIAEIIDGGTVAEVTGAVIPVVMSVGINVCFWVTVVFAILDRTVPVEAPTSWTPDRLPAPRETGARLSDLVGVSVWLLILAGAMIWDLTRGLVFLHGEWTSFLNPALWPGWFAVLTGLMIAEVVVAVLVYRTGRFTTGLAVGNAVLAAVSASVLLGLHSAGLLINPKLYDLAIASGAQEDLPTVIGALMTVGILGVAVWDATDGFRKARVRRAG